MGIFSKFKRETKPNPKKEWRKARNKNSKEDLLIFIKKYPDSEYVNEAKNKVELIDFTDVVDSDSIEKYRGFLNSYSKNSENYSTILSKLTKLEFEKAKNLKSISAIESFLETYPDSNEQEIACQEIANLLFVKNFQQIIYLLNNLELKENEIELSEKIRKTCQQPPKRIDYYDFKNFIDSLQKYFNLLKDKNFNIQSITYYCFVEFTYFIFNSFCFSYAEFLKNRTVSLFEGIKLRDLVKLFHDELDGFLALVILEQNTKIRSEAFTSLNNLINHIPLDLSKQYTSFIRKLKEGKLTEEEIARENSTIGLLLIAGIPINLDIVTLALNTILEKDANLGQEDKEVIIKTLTVLSS